MAMLDRSTLVVRCANASGVTADKAEEVLHNIVTVLGNTIKQEGVTIDDFGRFGPLPPAAERRGFQPHCGQVPYFRPAAKLVQAMATDEIPMKPGRRRTRGRPTAALRPEDDELIERWLRTRRGSEAERTNESILFEENQTGRRGPSVFWAEESVVAARSSLRAFARRCPTPIMSVGLVDNPGYAGIFDPRKLKVLREEGRITPAQYTAVVTPLRKEITAYANDYSVRATPRVAQLTAGRGSPKLVWRTMGWIRFVRCATDFYNWLEIQALRPQGSNPMQEIKHKSPKDFSKGKVMVVRKWYQEILEYPHLDPKERAVVALLSMGMRNGEAGHILLENIALKKHKITVRGKRNKIRVITLFPWVTADVAAYLETRRFSASPFLFPGAKGKGMHGWTVRALVAAIAGRVFPYPEQAHIREHIHPHGFRHWFCSQWLARGGKEKALMEQTGHENGQMLARYVHVDDDDVAREVKKLSKTPWIQVGRQ